MVLNTSLFYLFCYRIYIIAAFFSLFSAWQNYFFHCLVWHQQMNGTHYRSFFVPFKQFFVVVTAFVAAVIDEVAQKRCRKEVGKNWI